TGPSRPAVAVSGPRGLHPAPEPPVRAHTHRAPPPAGRGGRPQHPPGPRAPGPGGRGSLRADLHGPVAGDQPREAHALAPPRPGRVVAAAGTAGRRARRPRPGEPDLSIGPVPGRPAAVPTLKQVLHHDRDLASA